MKRWLITITILLVAGAVVNVAVAWCCAAWPEAIRRLDHDRTTDCERGWWTQHTPQSDSPVPVVHSRATAFGLRYSILDAPSSSVEVQVAKDQGEFTLSVKAGIPWNQVLRVRAGWPMPSLSGERWHFGHPIETAVLAGEPAGRTDDALFHATFPVIRMRASGSTERPIPLLPIWPGFAANTLSYAVILWLLIPGPFVLRRYLRMRHGLCPGCAYPMGDAPVCTECGRPLPGRAVV